MKGRARRRSLAASLALAACVLALRSATADESTSETMRLAEDELHDAEQGLSATFSGAAGAGGVDCATMCKALQSMVRAADRICALAEAGDESDRARCAHAREKVAEATKRVLAACPTCEAVPPKTPSPATVGTQPGTAGDATAAPPPMAYEDAYSETMVTAGVSARRARFSLTISPVLLVLPPVIAHVALETKLFDGVSFALGGGFGKLPARAPGNDISATTYMITGDLRGYLGGRFDGAYLAIAGQYVHASLADDAHLKSNLGPMPGVSTAVVLGWKLITASGFTLETRGGLGIVLKDDRHAGQVANKNTLFPYWDARIGWSF